MAETKSTSLATAISAASEFDFTREELEESFYTVMGRAEESMGENGQEELRTVVGKVFPDLYDGTANLYAADVMISITSALRYMSEVDAERKCERLKEKINKAARTNRYVQSQTVAVPGDSDLPATNDQSRQSRDTPSNAPDATA